ncbi:beta-lactamase family protein [Pacificimonas sp. WHA3]|uniref:Beta-lactamase family protein n=1 Tax=Pacificimonas pallii TaxID=2827236 RepID=A0ABS6SFA2_9SPHN|nr:serine hydrolase domain-containing protein [Pacificimonas pallii]MBV7257074.1 beta-lactamase family protein [Pacificimonas pallii]
MKVFQLSSAAVIFAMTAACAAQPDAVEAVDASNEGQMEQASDELLQSMDSRLATLVRDENIPSLSVAVVRPGGNIEYLSYGAKRRGQDAPVDENTIYQIASLSKLLTGVITNSLRRDGLIDLDAPLTTYLAPVLGRDGGEGLAGLTMAKLLHHHADIPNEACSLYAKRVDGEPWFDGYSRDALISDIRKLPAPDGAPSEFSYSNCGYAIVGLVDEVVSGQPYAALLQNRVAARYGMQDTGVVLSGDQENRLATPYRKNDKQVATQASVMGMGTPASAVYASARDLAKLQVKQLEAYRNHADKAAASDLVLSEVTATGPAENVRFGTGIIEVGHPAGKIYLHDGDADGFASFYAFAPQQDVGIVLLTGSGGQWFGDAGMEMMTMLMADAPASPKE